MAILLGLSAGCATRRAAPPNPPIAETLTPSAAAPAAMPLPADISGYWQGEGFTLYLINPAPNGFEVAYAGDPSHGIHYEIMSQSWAEGSLTWTARAPNTGYVVTLECPAMDGDNLACRWHGTAGSGEEALRRIQVPPSFTPTVQGPLPGATPSGP